MWVSYRDLERDLRPGDKVRIVEEWVVDEYGYARWCSTGDMDQYLDHVMTIDYVYDDNSCEMIEDDLRWIWFPEMIASVYVHDESPLDDVTSWQNTSLCSLFE